MEAMPEFMGYDRAIVTFSPDGRLFQVEYAREAVKRGTTSLGIVFKDGVVLAAVHPLGDMALSNPGSDKVQQIDDHLGIASTGFLADGRVLVDTGRVKAQIHKLTYDEPIHILGEVREISDKMQLYTQYGGVRPFGVAFLVGGVDENGSQLFEIDPSSAFFSWKAQAIGKGAGEASKVMKKGWKANLSRDDAIRIAIEALKAGEKGVKSNEIELAIVTAEKFEKHFGEEGTKFIKKYW